MSSFQDEGFFFHNNPEAEVQRSSFFILSFNAACALGFCLMVIVNEKPLNLALLLMFDGDKQNQIKSYISAEKNQYLRINF